MAALLAPPAVQCLLGAGPIDRVLAVVPGGGDLDGFGAADTLARIAALFGWGALDRRTLEVNGIRAVTPADLAAAEQAGGALKPLLFGRFGDGGVEAFAGPAFLPSAQPLANLQGMERGVHVAGAHVSNLFLSGPDLDLDVPPAISMRAIPTRSPMTAWFVRASFPGLVPPLAACARLGEAAGMAVESVVEHTADNARWLLVGRHSRSEIDAAAERLRTMHRIDAVMFRRVTNL